MCGRRVAKYLLCRCKLVSKGLYGVERHVHWRTDLKTVAIAVHASHEVGHAVWKMDHATQYEIHP